MRIILDNRFKFDKAEVEMKVGEIIVTIPGDDLTQWLPVVSCFGRETRLDVVVPLESEALSMIRIVYANRGHGRVKFRAIVI